MVYYLIEHLRLPAFATAPKSMLQKGESWASRGCTARGTTMMMGAYTKRMLCGIGQRWLGVVQVQLLQGCMPRTAMPTATTTAATAAAAAATLDTSQNSSELNSTWRVELAHSQAAAKARGDGVRGRGRGRGRTMPHKTNGTKGTGATKATTTTWHLILGAKKFWPFFCIIVVVAA